jgi:hypothetical protein
MNVISTHFKLKGLKFEVIIKIFNYREWKIRKI